MDDAVGELAIDVFQQQILVCQWFKGYVNWFSKVAEHTACRARSLQWLDPDETDRKGVRRLSGRLELFHPRTFLH